MVHSCIQLKVITSIALVAMTCVGLANCGGGTGSVNGDQMIIQPRPPTQGAPDLVVRLPTVSDNEPAAGAPFTLSATVRNNSDEAATTTLRYYRSTDATITPSDTSVGTDAVGALAASGTSSQSIALTAPSTPGPYYYGACVDAVSGESDTANNCSASVTVTVSEPPTQGAPDLVVRLPTVSDNEPAAGAPFTLSATVRNNSDEAATTTTLRYYRSTDATITPSDTSVGTDAVGALAASGTSSQSIALTAPSTPGPYYYGACVDAVSGETDTANNCSASVRVTVSAQTGNGAPDLVVNASMIVPRLEGVYPGDELSLSAWVRNAGTQTSASTTLRYYRSTDVTITPSDTPLGTDAVRALAASGTSNQRLALTAPSPGTYHYGACVDAVSGESDTANNCSAAVTVTVRDPTQEGAPDLVVYGVVLVASPVVYPGDSLDLSAGVRNDGDKTAQTTTLRYYRSADATITTSDTPVGTDPVGGLPAGATTSQSISLSAPSSPGTYHYGACVDAVSGESDTTNNCSTAVRVEVEFPS